MQGGDRPQVTLAPPSHTLTPGSVISELRHFPPGPASEAGVLYQLGPARLWLPVSHKDPEAHRVEASALGSQAAEAG